MTAPTLPRRVAFVGDYLPRKCGIATFTHDLRNAIASQAVDADCIVVPVNDQPDGYDYPAEVRFEIPEQDVDAYERAADFLHFSDAEVVSLQHEFGIYGGPAGAHILALLRNLEIPVVTTLHTVLESPTKDQRRVFQEMEQLSSRLVVMSERAGQMLRDIYKVNPEKIDLIPHGIPEMPFVDSNFFKDQFRVEGKQVILTFGLLSPGKGIEFVIRALPSVTKQFPDVVYIVLGATHPNLLREQGESYRLGLERLAGELGVKKHVIFYNRFVEIEELKEFLGAADIYITPYLNPAQITSGTLAYAFGCGKAVISTPYWHAKELLADDRGVLVPFANSDAIADALVSLLKDDSRRHSMRKRAYLLGREMTWSQVGHLYLESFRRARQNRAHTQRRRFATRTLEQEESLLPPLRIDHLERMSDSTGVFQHAQYSLPSFSEGYCSDDNARALLFTVLLEETGDFTSRILGLATSYAAFLNHAFIPESGRFRNFMSFNRHWLEDEGSQDCHGRIIWALGAAVGRSRRRSLQMWAAKLFELGAPALEHLEYPRSWAFGLVGIHEYFRRLSGDRLANQLRETLAGRLVDLFKSNATDDWPWFEHELTYDNAKLSHALILSGRWGNHREALDIGLRSLRWLTEIQTSETGHFRPIGSEGFYPKGGNRARFDQQPIEAHATVSACLEAFLTTQDRFWLNEARKAFDWFLGRNDIGQSVYDPTTGGCYDGLHVDRVNQNMGAESTLAFLLSLQEMRIINQALEAFDRPVESTPPTDGFLASPSVTQVS